MDMEKEEAMMVVINIETKKVEVIENIKIIVDMKVVDEVLMSKQSNQVKVA